jgi:hypothetical protein
LDLSRLIHSHNSGLQYCAIGNLHTFQLTVTHALGFSVFTSRILATYLSQSHCNFNSHMKSSWQSNSILAIFAAANSEDSARLLSTTVVYSCYSVSTTPVLPNTSYNHIARTPRKTPSTIVKNACLPINGCPSVACVCFAGMCLKSRLARVYASQYIHTYIHI